MSIYMTRIYTLCNAAEEELWAALPLDEIRKSEKGFETGMCDVINDIAPVRDGVKEGGRSWLLVLIGP